MDFNALPQRATLNNVATTTLGSFPVGTSVSTDWLATLRGRAGVTANNWLLYVTGGAAFTALTLAQYVDAPALINAGSAFGAASPSVLHVGWTVGAGLEHLLWDRWSVKGEYLFARFDGISTAMTVRATGGFLQSMRPTINHFDVHVARLGLNYRFR